MRNPTSKIPLNIQQHCHPRRKMPKNMTMKKPHSWVISPESKHRVPAARDLDCISQRCPRKIIRLVRIWVDVVAVRLEARRKDVLEGVVGAPAELWVLDCEDVEMMAVLCGIRFQVLL